MWTNHNPLLLCVSCAIAGSMFDGMALQFHSPSFIFIRRIHQLRDCRGAGPGLQTLIASQLDRFNMSFEWRMLLEGLPLYIEY